MYGTPLDILSFYANVFLRVLYAFNFGYEARTTRVINLLQNLTYTVSKKRPPFYFSNNSVKN